MSTYSPKFMLSLQQYNDGDIITAREYNRLVTNLKDVTDNMNNWLLYLQDTAIPSFAEEYLGSSIDEYISTAIDNAIADALTPRKGVLVVTDYTNESGIETSPSGSDVLLHKAVQGLYIPTSYDVSDNAIHYIPHDWNAAISASNITSVNESLGSLASSLESFIINEDSESGAYRTQLTNQCFSLSNSATLLGSAQEVQASLRNGVIPCIRCNTLQNLTAICEDIPTNNCGLYVIVIPASLYNSKQDEVLAAIGDTGVEFNESIYNIITELYDSDIQVDNFTGKLSDGASCKTDVDNLYIHYNTTGVGTVKLTNN